MRLFYHGRVTAKPGFLKLIIIFILVFAVYLLFKDSIKITGLGFNVDEDGYADVDLGNLVSYSNFYDGKQICTEGYHVKVDEFNVLKTDIYTTIYVNSVWIEYAKGRSSTFDSLLSRGQVARIYACGKFEAGRGRQFGEPSIWRKKLTIEEYKLLDKPKPI